MKRNPIECRMREYYDSVCFKKIRPRFFYQRCSKCKNEFKNEDMYRCIYQDDFLFYVTSYYYGCSECFKNLDQFKEYCREHVLWQEEDWMYNGEFCLPFYKQLRNNDLDIF